MKRQPKWLQALGNTSDGVFVSDATQRIILWNKGAERLLGYSGSEVLQRHCYEVIAGRVRSGKQWCRSNCKVQRFVQGGRLVPNFNLRTATKEGREVWVNLSITALPNRKPLTLHLLRSATRQEQNEEMIEDILGTLRTHGALRHRRESKRGTARSSAPSALLTSPLGTLTPREWDVLRLLTKGLSTEAIAKRLKLSPLTVRKHVQNLLRKSGVHNRTQAVCLALKNGFC
jgi:PAS domain S-box-containing protein